MGPLSNHANNRALAGMHGKLGLYSEGFLGLRRPSVASKEIYERGPKMHGSPIGGLQILAANQKADLCIAKFVPVRLSARFLTESREKPITQVFLLQQFCINLLATLIKNAIIEHRSKVILSIFFML